MTRHSNIFSPYQALCALLFTVAICAASDVQAISTTNERSFEGLKGWWIGYGRLGFQNGKTENVKCRATYDVRKPSGQHMRQVVRCASPSGNVEVESNITQTGKMLAGTWNEKRYEFAGEITGRVLRDGFRVTVNGARLMAQMTVTMR